VCLAAKKKKRKEKGRGEKNKGCTVFYGRVAVVPCVCVPFFPLMRALRA
jgi:hypothetical protein